MAPAHRTNRLSTALVLLMILSALAPMMAPHIGIESADEKNTDSNALKQADRTMNTGARAPCPAVQSDAGTAGDAGNTTATAKSQGSDPTVTNIDGCVDATDDQDWYSIQISSNKDVVVVLRDFGDGTNIDFDLVVSDSTGGNPATGTGYVDYSMTYSATERVEFTTNSTTAGMHYVQIWQYAGDGNYKFDIWVNNSVPKPDLSVNSISGPVNATAGDVVDVTYTIENFGPGDTNSTNPYDVVFILSTDDTYDWSDTIVESQIAGPYLTAGSSSVETSQLTIPADIESDDYYWIVWPDGWGNVTEADDLNNNNASSAVTTISGMPCPNENDASTGGDVGDTEAEAYDLGAGFTGVITGCVAAGDKGDLYKLSMGRGQNITAVLSADNWDADIDLRLWNTSTSGSTGLSAIDSSAGTASNESVTTAGSDADGAADTYYINVTHYSGLANYTLEIWTNGTIFIPPYDCGPHADWGQTSYDAGSERSTAYDIGDNPESIGRGCMDPADLTDAYRFSLSGMQGSTIELESDNATDMHIELYQTENGVDQLIVESQMTNGVASVDTTSIPFDELDGNYFILVNAIESGEQWDTGWYNLTFTPIAAPLPDLVAEPATCPLTAETTGYSAPFMAQVSSIGGPMDATAFGWDLALVDEDGVTVMTLLTGDHSDSLEGNDGVIDQDGEQILLGNDISSGNYTCVLTVDRGNVVAESDETNNVWTSLPFEIINEEELYADDVDRDGVPNDLDGCPNTPGDSTMDRLGCQDNDGDGYSNGGDVFIYEPTQWNDTDGDMFGDNNGPDDYNGDDCPNEPGVASGTNGTGCPIWNADADGDGIPDTSDQCPGTPVGATTNLVGCSDVDGDGVYQPTDQCPETPAGTQVDATGCALSSGTGDGDNNDDSGDSGDAEGTTEGGSNTLLYIIIAASVVLLLVVVLGATVMVRSGGNSDPTEQAWATAISPEQQAYEQQLVGMGYTADQARAYASQYFQK